MYKKTFTTTGRQVDFLAAFLQQYDRTCNLVPGSIELTHASFARHLRPLPEGKEICLVTTTFAELCALNGLTTVPAKRGSGGFMNLAVPNFLAWQLGLVPLGHALGLEVFGQGLHLTTVPQVEDGWVICTVDASAEVATWDEDRKHLLFESYFGDALRLEQRRAGICQTYATTHVARECDRFLLLYTEQGSR